MQKLMAKFGGFILDPLDMFGIRSQVNNAIDEYSEGDSIDLEGIKISWLSVVSFVGFLVVVSFIIGIVIKFKKLKGK